MAKKSHCPHSRFGRMGTWEHRKTHAASVPTDIAMATRIIVHRQSDNRARRLSDVRALGTTSSSFLCAKWQANICDAFRLPACHVACALLRSSRRASSFVSIYRRFSVCLCVRKCVKSEANYVGRRHANSPQTKLRECKKVEEHKMVPEPEIASQKTANLAPISNG